MVYSYILPVSCLRNPNTLRTTQVICFWCDNELLMVGSLGILRLRTDHWKELAW